MKVATTAIQAAIYGAERDCVKERSDWITPSRFSEKQIRTFSKKPSLTAGFGRESFLLHSAATAGITLDFITNSVSLAFEYRGFAASKRQICWFDILVNGRLFHHAGKNGQPSVAGKVSLTLPQGEKRITIYFPCLYKGELKNLEIDDGASFIPTFDGTTHKKILFVGDSITQGYATPYNSLTYSNILTRKLQAECLNQGIGGAIYNPADLDDSLSFSPNIIVTAYGTNDWFWRRDIETTAPAYYRRLAEIYPDAKIYALLPIWRGDSEELELLSRRPFMEHREIIRKAAEVWENVTVIDTIEFVPHDATFFEDQALHPNELGFLMYADALLEAIGDSNI